MYSTDTIHTSAHRRISASPPSAHYGRVFPPAHDPYITAPINGAEIMRFYRCCPRMKFFLSSHLYLHTSSLTWYRKRLFPRLFRFNDPNFKSKGYPLSIDVGHYGLYYTIFNRDTECSPTINVVQLFNPFIFYHFYNPVHKSVGFSFILQVSKELAGTVSTFGRRSFSTCRVLEKVSSTPVGEERAEQRPEAAAEAYSGLLEGVQGEMVKLYGAEAYDLIFPMYQSLKRNGAVLDLSMYNIVLESITKRTVDANDQETRLTNLLTVYQDMLSEQIKPTNHTYQLVINGLLNGCVETINTYKTKTLSYTEYESKYIKAQEFALVTVDLMNSLSCIKLDLQFDKLFLILNQFPNLANAQILKLIFESLIKDPRSHKYYVELIQLTPQLVNHGILTSKKQAYDFIMHLYQEYQGHSSKWAPTCDYQVYKSMAVALVDTDNGKSAIQLVDSVLANFRQAYVQAHKPHVSDLISHFLIKIASNDVSEAYKLYSAFNEVAWIPEVLMECANYLIDQFITTRPSKDIPVWEIVNRHIARHDFVASDALLQYCVVSGDSDGVFKLTKAIMVSDKAINVATLRQLMQFYNQIGGSHVSVGLMEAQGLLYENKLGLFNEIADLLPAESSSSLLVQQAFESVDLVNDKIFAVVDYLKRYRSGNLAAILQDKFNEAEMVYYNLDEDLEAFKNLLVGDEKPAVVDLSVFFRVSQSLGIKMFTLYKKAHRTFNEASWTCIISSKPLLKKNLDHILKQSNTHMVNMILRYNDDAISIKVLKSIPRLDQSSVDILLQNVSTSNNVYFWSLFSKRYQLDDEVFLRTASRFEENSRGFVNSDFTSASNSAAYLKYLLSKDLVKFEERLIQVLQGDKGVLDSPEMREVIQQYYVVSGRESKVSPQTNAARASTVRGAVDEIFASLHTDKLQAVVEKYARVLKLHRQTVISMLLDKINGFGLSYKTLTQFFRASGTTKLSSANFVKLVQNLLETDKYAAQLVYRRCRGSSLVEFAGLRAIVNRDAVLQMYR